MLTFFKHTFTRHISPRMLARWSVIAKPTEKPFRWLTQPTKIPVHFPPTNYLISFLNPQQFLYLYWTSNTCSVYFTSTRLGDFSFEVPSAEVELSPVVDFVCSVLSLISPRGRDDNAIWRNNNDPCKSRWCRELDHFYLILQGLRVATFEVETLNHHILSVLFFPTFPHP